MPKVEWNKKLKEDISKTKLEKTEKTLNIKEKKKNKSFELAAGLEDTKSLDAKEEIQSLYDHITVLKKLAK